MYELHNNEQYFFDDDTIKRLILFLDSFKNNLLCCLCAPLLGKELDKNGFTVDILDIDNRFSDLNNFLYYDVRKSRYVGVNYNLIICDPPFFSVKLSQLFSSIYRLTHFNFEHSLLISYLKRRESALLGTFSGFNLKPTGIFPAYQTVDTSKDKNRIEFYSNIEGIEKFKWYNLLTMK